MNKAPFLPIVIETNIITSGVIKEMKQSIYLGRHVSLFTATQINVKKHKKTFFSQFGALKLDKMICIWGIFSGIIKNQLSTMNLVDKTIFFKSESKLIS